MNKKEYEFLLFAYIFKHNKLYIEKFITQNIDQRIKS